MDAEGWPVGVGVCHLAEHHALLAELLMSVAKGERLPPWAPRKLEDLDTLNAQIAARNTGRTKEEALSMLRRNGVATAQKLRSLDDEQLDKKMLLEAAGLCADKRRRATTDSSCLRMTSEGRAP